MKTIIFARSTEIYNDSRATKTIQTLANAGYHIIVLGWDRTGQATFQYKNIDVLLFQKKFVSSGTKGKIIKKISLVLSFNRWLKKQLKRYAKQTAFIHSCDLDTGWISYKIAKKYKIKLVYDIYDYYVHARSLPKPLAMVLEKREIKVINFAHTTILCTEQRIAQISRAKPNNIVIIHNTPKIPVLDNGMQKNHNDDIKIVFIGSLGEDRLLQEIAGEIIHRNDIKLTIGGFGKYSELYNKLSTEHENITFLGPLSFKDTLDHENKNDILFACYNPEIKNHEFSAPNKVYHAMAMSKPVIVCKDTGIDKLVANGELGLVIDYDAKSFFNAVDKLCDGDLRNQLGKNGNDLYKKNYSYEVMEKRLLEIYNEESI